MAATADEVASKTKEYKRGNIVAVWLAVFELGGCGWIDYLMKCLYSYSSSALPDGTELRLMRNCDNEVGSE